MADRKKAGRPPRFTSAEEIQRLVDEYFESCEKKQFEINGEPCFDKNGKPIFLDAHPPTITGLALALGFNSRQSLLNYQGKKEFFDTITRAKSRVEKYAEERLFDRDGVNGARFSLMNNFEGWNNKPAEDDPAGDEVVIINDAPG